MKLFHRIIPLFLLVATLLQENVFGQQQQGSKEGLRRLRQMNDEDHRQLHRRVCRASCPCCSRSFWPEFVKAVDGISNSQGGICYERLDDESRIISLLHCGDYGDRSVAYMSFDYINARGEPRYCGSSGSDIQALTRRQAIACDNILRDLVDQNGIVCGDSFDC